MAERPYDVVLLGATGFTGQLVAERLARVDGLRWAIAGRDPHKIRDVKAGLVGLDLAAGQVGTLTADVRAPESLGDIARSARVLVTTVGPYQRHGGPVLEACVREGTHYLDLTGEPEFVAESLQRHDSAARQRGVKIVHCCGFDSIPADLGALYTVQLLPDGPRRVRGYLKTRGRPSGGTWASLLDILAAGAGARPKRRLPKAPAEVGGVAMPLPTVDADVVLHSARLLPDVYGADFTYEHFLRQRTRRRALRVVAGVGALAAAARAPVTRTLLRRLAPSGQGPSDEERARSFFELTLIGEAGRRRVVTRVSGGDPGYTETSKMLATCARLLALEPERLPDRAGVLTTAAAFGDPLREALHAQGISFETLSEA